jgi:hypothetical protein
LTSVSPYLNVYSVTIANISQNSISVPINIGLSKQTVKTLIDSSAGDLFIDQNFAKNFEINYLDKPVNVVLRKLSWLSHMTTELDISKNQLGSSLACSSWHIGSAQLST